MKEILYTVFCAAVAMVGYTIHNSIFWSIIDFFFAPLALAKWLIFHELTLQVLKSTFAWFFV